jgi:hypothetical protein
MFKPRNSDELEFTEKPFYFSYSSLNKLVFCPKIFYNQYVLKQKEEQLQSYLVEGKVIHCLLLEGDKFNEQFIISPLKLPSPSNKQLLDKLFAMNQSNLKLNELKNEVLTLLVEIDLHQSLKTDEQRLAKIITIENESYFNFLKESKSKIIIDNPTFEKCKRATELIKENKDVKQNLVTKSSWELLDCFNEHFLQYWDEELGFGVKGIIDNVVVDYQNNVVIINDLKTTSKSIADFSDTVQFYNYWLQAAIYVRLVQKVLLLDKKDWQIKFNFIVIDNYEQVYCFPVSNESLTAWENKLSEKLEEAKSILNSGDFSLPYEFQTGTVIL